MFQGSLQEINNFSPKIEPRVACEVLSALSKLNENCLIWPSHNIPNAYFHEHSVPCSNSCPAWPGLKYFAYLWSSHFYLPFQQEFISGGFSALLGLLRPKFHFIF
jgi:hypothetical protein